MKQENNFQVDKEVNNDKICSFIRNCWGLIEQEIGLEIGLELELELEQEIRTLLTSLWGRPAAEKMGIFWPLAIEFIPSIAEIPVWIISSG